MRKSQDGWKSFFCPHLPESGATKWCICVLSSPLGARVIGNFVLCLLSWTNNSKLLPFKLSKINTYHPVISLGFSKTPLDHQNDHLDSHLDHHYHWSISLSLWVFSEQTRKSSGSSRPTDQFWKRKDYSHQLPIICLSSSFSINISFVFKSQKRRAAQLSPYRSSRSMCVCWKG